MVLLLASGWLFLTRENFAQQLVRFYASMRDPFWVPARLRFHPGSRATRVMAILFALASFAAGVAFVFAALR